ncbi:MAG: DHA2 family efflux MFS transporter permease subunit [Gemmatimonadaceae bacterium]|nr:DHA2 family efflux MFS transporter permease subunit [Gemmatimonadaceae bacterium]
MALPHDDAWAGDPHRWMIALAATLASVIQVIDTSIVNVAIPHMMGELGASLDEIAWVSTGYIVAAVIVMPMSGWLAAYFGRKRYFAASILIFTVASFFCGASHTLGTLILWRLVQGVGGGALLTTSQAIIYEAFPRREIGMAMAVFGLGVMVGPTLGPTLGGWLTDAYSWPWIFYINLPVGAAAAAMVLAYVHDAEHHVKATTVDWLGIGLLILAIGSLQYLLEHGQGEGWFESGLITGLAVVSGTAMALLVWRELTIAEPIIDFKVLRHREMWVGTTIGIFMGVALFGSVFVLPIYLQSMLRMSAWQTGMVILPGAMATAFSMALSGRLVNRFDARLLIVAGISLFGVAMWQLSRMTAQTGADDFFWPLIVRGIGLGLMFVPLTNLTLQGLARTEIAAGTALSSFSRQIGGSLGIAALATLLTHHTRQAKAVLAEHVTLFDGASLERLGGLARGFQGRGMDAASAQQLAYTVLDRQLTAQASVIAFGKVFLASGAILVATLPLLLVVSAARPRPAGAGAPAMVHAE